MLSADNDGVHPDWDNGTVVMLVLDSDLGLGVGSEPWQASISAGSRHSGVELVCQLKGQGEQLWGLIGGISEHDTLIASTELLECLLIVEALSDIWRLLLNGNQNVTGLVVEALCGVVVSDVLNGLTDDLLVIDTCLGGDFSKDHNHTSLGGSLASNLGKRVLCQASVEDSIRDLISDLIGVPLSYRLGLVFGSAQVHCVFEWGEPAYGEQE